MVRSKAPIRYITQSGVVGAWAGGGGSGGGGGGTGLGAVGGKGVGAGCGTGKIIDGNAGGGIEEVGNESVVKVPTALQAL